MNTLNYKKINNYNTNNYINIRIFIAQIIIFFYINTQNYNKNNNIYNTKNYIFLYEYFELYFLIF